MICWVDGVFLGMVKFIIGVSILSESCFLDTFSSLQSGVEMEMEIRSLLKLLKIWSPYSLSERA